MTEKVFHLLFLCTGNSCRSQMAEGWARKLARQYGDDWLAVESAGIEAHGKNPRAIAVMADAGLDISNQESTRLTDEMLSRIDLVVSVCGHADEHCPLFSGPTQVTNRPFDDPPKLAADAQTREEALDQYRRVRDQIRIWVESLPGALDR